MSGKDFIKKKKKANCKTYPVQNIEELYSFSFPFVLGHLHQQFWSFLYLKLVVKNLIIGLYLCNLLTFNIAVIKKKYLTW